MRVHYESIVPPNRQIKQWLPLAAVKKAGTQEDLIVEVPMRERRVKARVWKVRVGRVELLLLDSDLRDNSLHDRHITRKLYQSKKHNDEERLRRLEQEVLLGIGGVTALRGAGYTPAVYHLNEGHVGFAILEVIRDLIQREGLSFAEAKECAAKRIGFTTHTPVPEGNERFDEALVREHLHTYLDSFLKREEKDILFNAARNKDDQFDMTKFSLMLSGVFRNGVSKLHGDVCRKMWAYAWAIQDPEGRGVPIDSITNAVHVPYWQKTRLRDLIADAGGLEKITEIPDKEFWDLHLQFRSELIAKVRERLAYQLLREEVEANRVYELTHDLFSMDGFFIGFARRFAQYKRVTMLLEDEERLFNFLENTYRKYQRPVHILFAGKPHPDNLPGRASILHIYDVSRRLAERCRARNFKAQIAFVQGYDVNLARFLESGCDIWLNNPIRPLEASGTSGMKAAINGVLNVSISDGWVPEGIVHGENGWIFGKGEANSTDQDRQELFRLLEETILPLYFHGVQTPADFAPGWVKMMKHSIYTITKYFNTDRMLREYIEKMYLPAVQNQEVSRCRP